MSVIVPLPRLPIETSTMPSRLFAHDAIAAVVSAIEAAPIVVVVAPDVVAPGAVVALVVVLVAVVGARPAWFPHATADVVASAPRSTAESRARGVTRNYR